MKDESWGNSTSKPWVWMSLEPPSKDSDGPLSPELQKEIRNIIAALRNEGVEAEPAEPEDFGFLVNCSSVVGDANFIHGLLIPIAQLGFPAVAGITGAWLRGMFGRKVKIEFYHDGRPNTIEAETPDQVTSLIKVARREARPWGRLTGENAK
jgi:hypothetical protein